MTDSLKGDTQCLKCHTVRGQGGSIGPDLSMIGKKASRENLYDSLLTAVGLRSLAPGHPDYRPRYYGDLRTRDAAYHQGTVWSWLLGPYVDAIMKVKGEKGKAEVKKIVENISLHFNDAGIGNISEIFDGDEPHTSRGCIAQAWSIGELLRVIKTYKLFAEKKERLKKELEAI